MSSNPSPRVVVLNGGSSSGKSSITRTLQESLPGTWLTFGVDAFIDALPGRGDSPRAGIVYRPAGTISVSPGYRALEDIWYAALAGMAMSGAHLILDEVLLAGGTGQEHLGKMFHDLPVVWVGVRCEPEVAAARESQRTDRVPGMARQQALSVHGGMRYDVEVDTTHRSAEDCALDITRWIAAWGRSQPDQV
ncbi:chloramphenicol phosphotransferase [Arthrobacter citreus]|uniref:Chloramphenicol phosphotransferase n=1 Tax=Arthrobacter citreus TaxID=1670 RepID=A0ABZ2ZVU8_9MICC